MRKRKRIRFARITSLALTASMIITMNGVSVAAGSVHSAVKSEEEWIKISSVRDFQRISKNLDGNYILTDDIDFRGKSYQPIGDNKEPFTGTLNGDGHILSNVNIEAEDQKDSLFAGLFGVADSAKISDLAVEECEISSDTQNGIYAGVIAGKMNNTSLENVYVDGKITSEKDTAYTLGGIAGAVFQNNDTAQEEIEYNISSAVSNVEIQTAKGAHGEKGTLAGYVEDTALVQNSYALIDHEKLFGTELTEKNGCGILSEETREKKDCYIGFDFAKVWKITKGGARLQSQTYTEQKSGDGKEKKETTAFVVTGSATKSQEENKESLQVASLGKKIKTFASSLKASANDLISLTSTGDLVSGDYTYTVSGGNATITGYTGSAGSLTIPESLDGNTVTGIGYEAFKGNTTIKNISIPKQIATIGSSAFAGCSSLETVELHYNDAMINTSASGVQPYSLSIGDNVFENDEKLMSINLTENVTSIGSYAFAGCTEMSSLTLPESLKSIGHYMIKGTKISSITIPKNVTYSVSSGMNGAMSGALKLNTVIFEEGMTKIPDYVCASNSYTSYITKVVIPDTVESIGGCAFYECESLSTVSIPKQVASIGSSAFAGCSSLETVELHYNDAMINTSASGVQPYSLSIGAYAFENDEKLTSINLTENVTSIGNNAFAGCTEMSSLTLPESLKSIGYYMIKGTKISSITIPKNVTYSVSNGMNGAMSGALKLNTVIFEEGITKIPSYICASDDYTSYITKVVIPDTVESIGDYSFYKCESLSTVSIPKRVASIGRSAFAGCSNLETVELHYNDEMINTSTSGVQPYSLSIGDNVFENDEKLTSINLTENVTSIGDYAFAGCTEMNSLTLPESLTRMGYYVIKGTKISSITIPKNVEYSNTDYPGTPNGAMAGALKLNTVIFEEGMTRIPNYICASDDYTSYITKVVIPDTVESIGDYSFYKCESLSTVSIPKQVASIGRSAFAGCSNLETVELHYNDEMINTSTSGVQPFSLSIGDNVFENDEKLTSINLTENVTSIGSYAFAGCTEMSSLTLPESLKNIGHYMIKGTKISSIIIPKNVKYSNTDYPGTPNGAMAGALKLNTVIFEEGMTRIPNYICASYSYTSYITKVVIPDTVESIGDKSFYNCNNLTIYGYKNSYAEEYATENSIPFVSVAISKNMTAAQVLAKLDTKKLLNNISLGSATVDGPTVTVGNKTFTLFSIPTSMDVELGDKVQAKVDTEKKTIQVMIGFDEFSGSAKLDGDSNSDTYWKESYKKVKSLYTGVTGKTKGTKDLYNGFRSMRHHLKKFDASMSVKASASAAGYIEFSYASGEIVFSNGGVLLEAELGSSWDYPLACAPAVYVTFGLSAGFDGSLTLVRQDTMNYTPGIDANFALKATMGVGAGAKKLKTYAEVGLNGSLNVGVAYTPGDNLADTLTLKLKSSMYAKGEVFGYDVYSVTRDFDDVQLYPKGRSRMKTAFSNVNIPYELEEAENSDRTNGIVTHSSLQELAAAPNITYAEKDVYKYCAPQLAYLNDGTMLLVWIDDDSSKTNVNKTSLMYSVFDGASWSTPESIGETGGANDYPSIHCDGEKVDIVWQKADKLDEDATLTELLKTVELYSVTYSDGKMGEVTQVTSDNSVYEMMQAVAVNGDQKTVVWVENSDNDPFQATGTESIQMAVYDDGKWTRSTVAGDLENVSNLCASYAGDKLQIAYETVSGDAGKIVLVWNGKSTEFTGTNAELESGILYYTDDKGMQAYDAATNVTEMIRQGVSGEFTVLDNGTDKALVTTIYNGYDSELVYYCFDRTTGEWSDEVKLTDEKKYIRDYSAVMDKNGKISAAVNFITIDEDEIYGDAELEVRSFADIEDVTVSDTAYYDNDAVVPGTRLPLHFTVKNNGTVTLESLNIEVLDKDGSVLENGTMDCTLISGEETELTYEYLLPETIANQSLSIKAYTDKEVKLSDNTADFEIGFADLAVGQVYLSGTKADAVLKGTVLNQGYVDAENVTVKVYSGNAEGDLIETKTFNTLRKSDEKAFEVSIPEAYLEVNPLVDGNALYVVAETTSEEGDYSNNSAIYMVKSETEQSLVLNQESVTLRSGESAQVDLVYSAVLDPKTAEVSWKSEDEAVAVVDAGRITAVGTGKTTITAETGGYTAVCEVTVSDDVAVTGISLSDATVMLTAGETKQITANVLPANATNKKVTWESSNPSVAEVSNNGLVQALAVGKAEISAMSEDGSKRASLKVTVYQEADSICTVKFSGGTGASGSRPKSLKGTTGTLVTLPENSYEKDGFEFVGWTDGKNTYPEGSQYRIPYTDVTLTAVWNEIPVVQYTIVSSAEEGGKISPSGETLVNEGESQEYTITAEEGYILADVQVDGESVGAVSSYIFENIKGDHTIKALFRKEAVVKVESIVLDQTKVTLEKTQTITLNASIAPEDATDQQLKWTTSDVEVASVAGGVVTAVGAGTAEITAEAQDGSGVKAVCEVTVTENAGQPDPSGTPKPTADPNATGIPEPTEEPDTTVTSKPTVDPNETETPKPVKTPENTRTPQTTKQLLQTLIPEPTEQPARVDKAGRIILDKANSWEKLLETVSFGIYKAPNTTVTIESYLENSSRYYYVDNSGEETVKDITALKSDDISWKEYTGEISLESDKNVVYAKIIDNSTQQEYYLCSDGIVIRKDGDQVVTEVPVTTGQPGSYAVPTPAGNTGSTVIPTPTGKTGSAAAPTQSPKATSTAKAAVGKVIKDSSGTTYKVTAGNTVEYTQPEDQSLTSVVIPETVVLNGVSYKVTSISKSALADCTKLKKVSIGKNITVIGDKAFYNCKALTKIVIPASVVKIGKQAFAKCKKLKQITIKTSKLTDQSVGKNAFKGIYKKPVVKVPKSRKKLYKKVLKAKGMSANASIK